MNFIKILFIALLSILTLNQSFAKDYDLSIIDIDSSNSKIVKLFFDNEIFSQKWEINSELKLFNDLKIDKIIKDLTSNKIVELTLLNELENNTSYSLLSVYWSEWTIDFKIDDTINWLEINWDWTTWIDKIFIIDNKHLKIYFTNDIVWEDIDIKLLKEYTVKSLFVDSINNKILNIELNDRLSTNSKYLIMLFSFTNNEWDTFNVLNSIYDFTTLSNLNNEKLVENNVINEDEQTWNIALNSAETPDTWAETWVVLLATFILSNFIYFRKKFSK